MSELQLSGAQAQKPGFQGRARAASAGGQREALKRAGAQDHEADHFGDQPESHRWAARLLGQADQRRAREKAAVAEVETAAQPDNPLSRRGHREAPGPRPEA